MQLEKIRGPYPGNVWTIILAGGEGQRLGPLVRRWLGHHKPKQYCTFIGTRSMLQHTISRAHRISAEHRKVIVTVRSHLPYLQEQLKGIEGGKIILQPENRETAVGIMMAISYIRKQDPEASVVILPSDHFIFPEQRFVQIVKNMLEATEEHQDYLFLLGIPPETTKLDYGLVEQGFHLGWKGANQVHSVTKFHEKPSKDLHVKLIAHGALWNTFIMASQQRTLWNLGYKTIPEVMTLTEEYGKASDSPLGKDALDEIYSRMPSCNFSEQVLEKIPQNLAVMEMHEILWSDWGRQERIERTLLKIGKRPAYWGKLQPQVA